MLLGVNPKMEGLLSCPNPTANLVSVMRGDVVSPLRTSLAVFCFFSLNLCKIKITCREKERENGFDQTAVNRVSDGNKMAET